MVHAGGRGSECGKTFRPEPRRSLARADMTDITVSFPEERLAKLREMAAAYGISAEELVRATIDQLLGIEPRT